MSVWFSSSFFDKHQWSITGRSIVEQVSCQHNAPKITTGLKKKAGAVLDVCLAPRYYRLATPPPH